MAFKSKVITVSTNCSKFIIIIMKHRVSVRIKGLPYDGVAVKSFDMKQSHLKILPIPFYS